MNTLPPIREGGVRKRLLRWTTVALLAVAGSLAVALLSEHTLPQTPPPENARRLAATGASLEAVPTPASTIADPAPTQADDPAVEEQPPTF